jgi:hypothetical protein
MILWLIFLVEHQVDSVMFSIDAVNQRDPSRRFEESTKLDKLENAVFADAFVFEGGKR